MSHIEYFNLSSYFNGKRLLCQLGLQEAQGKAGEAEMTADDIKTLESALQQADKSSKERDIAGIYHLIRVAEELAKKYGIAKICEHQGESLQQFLDEIIQQPELVKHYGLENYANQAKQRREGSTQKVVQVATPEKKVRGK